jgi:hypothetical protein
MNCGNSKPIISISGGDRACVLGLICLTFQDIPIHFLQIWFRVDIFVPASLGPPISANLR